MMNHNMRAGSLHPALRCRMGCTADIDAFTVKRDRQRLAPLDPVKNILDPCRIRNRSEEQVNAAPAWQANIEIGRAGPESCLTRSAAFDHVERFGDHGCLDTSAGKGAVRRTILGHCHMRTRVARRCVGDCNQRDQGCFQLCVGLFVQKPEDGQNIVQTCLSRSWQIFSRRTEPCPKQAGRAMFIGCLGKIGSSTGTFSHRTGGAIGLTFTLRKTSPTGHPHAGAMFLLPWE